MFLFIYIFTGIILGPSFVNMPSPDWLFSLCALGFLLMAGLELKLKDLNKNFSASMKVALGAFVVPFVAGLAFSTSFLGSKGFQASSIVALALAISALPVVVQILKGLKLYGSPLGAVIISAATLCDILAWLIFTILIPNESRESWLLSHLPVLFFFLGLALSGVFENLKLFHRLVLKSSRWFFAPIFFIGVGMKIHWQESFNLQQCLLILAVAFLSKILGVYASARWSSFSHQNSVLMALVLNARGAMEILFCSTAFKLGLIDATLFTSLTLMAILSSVMADPLARLGKWIPQP